MYYFSYIFPESKIEKYIVLLWSGLSFIYSYLVEWLFSQWKALLIKSSWKHKLEGQNL